ncbi:DUF3857 domain-containing transglutaminase family protein [Pedobacter faecalis]|uniref:DUF3857 domain-containing transglutaminase family protein n=1 Tax=Pedobacter faecalis TaxID=3041495 RepID=UPI00254C1E83|nr:DUF3857 domain-containing transglutaminase family protein [Pedobacter sp. ELA7]
MRKLSLLFALALCLCRAVGQETYPVSNIAVDMLRGASVVVRNEELRYEVKSTSSATMTYKMVATILNKGGEEAAVMYEHYDKFSNVYNLKATVYDAQGKKIRTYKASDFSDRSAVSEGTLYQDDRVKYADFSHSVYPYTVEYSYAVDYNGIRTYPAWIPVNAWNMAVEKSSFVFTVPGSLKFRYQQGQGLKADSVTLKDKVQYTWSCGQVKALEYEPMSAGLNHITPWVKPAPNLFDYDKSKASIENWEQLGLWMYGLSKDAQKLPDVVRANVSNLTKDCKSDREKIAVLYRYLQQNTRYVGVQLGIGGYQPISAEKVSAVNYGDCKGLSNYMKAMLEAVGIRSHLVVIGHDLPSFDSSFASISQGNHMILCVPMEKDSVWLECTSRYLPPGYIGEGNSDRTVLLVTEKGGQLARTPAYRPAQNFLKRQVAVRLKGEGDADISINTRYGCVQYEDNMSMLIVDPTDRRKKLLQELSIPNIQLGDISYVQPDLGEPVMQEKLSMKSSQLLTKGADKLFLTLNLLQQQRSAPEFSEVRKTPFIVKYSYDDDEEIIYTLPEGYKVEFVPKDVVIESEFGKYTASVVAKDNALVYTRRKTMTNRTYAAEKYKDYVAFSKKIYQADKMKGILVKVQ